MKKPPEGTLCLPNALARESVIKALQVITGRHSPGHHEYERADHAVELALSPGRAAKSAPYLMRNVDRDARRTLKNQNKNPGPVFLSSLEAALNKKADGDNAPASVETVLPAAKTPEPIDELIAEELEGMVRKAIVSVPNGDECLNAMLIHESPGDTAERLGISVHSVWRTRSVIRERVESLLA